MPIMRNVHLISVQSWTYLVSVVRSICLSKDSESFMSDLVRAATRQILLWHNVITIQTFTSFSCSASASFFLTFSTSALFLFSKALCLSVFS